MVTIKSKSICDYNHNDNDPSIATENLEQMRIWLVQGFELGFVRCLVIHSCYVVKLRTQIIPFTVLGRHPSPIPATSVEDESKVEF